MSDESLQKIVCCLGQPVAGNPTQYMMERAFRAAELDWRYLTLEVAPADLGAALAGMQAMGFRGGNLLAPHKTAVVPLLDQLSDSARLIGAVNLLYRRGDQMCGENTDGRGFLAALREICDPVGRRVEILGAGSAARAIAFELALAQAAEIRIVNRNADHGQALCRDLAAANFSTPVTAEFVPWAGTHPINPQTEILIQATSVGHNDGETVVPLDFSTLAPHLVVADLVYNPSQTEFLRLAVERGCPTLDGLSIYVQQAALWFQAWTGIAPDITAMREALEEFLGF